MIDEFFPSNSTALNDKKTSVQSLLFGHRIKPQQTRYEYLVEFLQVAMARKNIGEDLSFSEMFPICEDVNRQAIEYHPISNMGLKRFLFFNNSRLDTKSEADREAYKKCISILNERVNTDGIDDLSADECITILQNVLYGFSIENAGRSWFYKTLFPVCPAVLFPESVGRKNKRKDVVYDSPEVDSSFDFNSYTYMARGGEVYYLHLLHAANAQGEDRCAKLEKQLRTMINSIPELSRLCDFIQNEWIEGNQFEENDLDCVKKTIGFIPSSFGYRDANTLSELICFLSNQIQPMEKMDILSYGIVLQLFRLMTTTAAKGSGTCGSAWVLDMCNSGRKEQAEIRKLASKAFSMNEEAFTKYIDIGIEHFHSDWNDDEKAKYRKGASEDTVKLVRKLGKGMGIIIPINGQFMRFTLSEEVIKFLVMSLIPPTSKVTFDHFLDLLYDHFEMVVSAEHYLRAVNEGKAAKCSSLTFLNENKTAFAQKLKNCGFLRDLSDATAIVENPYEMEDD